MQSNKMNVIEDTTYMETPVEELNQEEIYVIDLLDEVILIYFSGHILKLSYNQNDEGIFITGDPVNEILDDSAKGYTIAAWYKKYKEDHPQG